MIYANMEAEQKMREEAERKAKELAERREAEFRANEERANKDIEELSYRIALRNFNELVSGNRRAMAEMYRLLKDAYEDQYGQ